MLSTANKYPFSDYPETQSLHTYAYKQYQPLIPTKAGEYVPFNLDGNPNHWQQFYNGATTRGLIITPQLLSKPLVIAFYSKYWGAFGINRLIELNAIHAEIRAHGGNLLVVSAERDDNLGDIAWQHSLSLNFYFDTDKNIAKKFGVWADDNPTWNHYPAVNVNIPLLGIYVADTSKHITYQHVDFNLEAKLSARPIITAVYQSALSSNRKRSA